MTLPTLPLPKTLPLRSRFAPASGNTALNSSSTPPVALIPNEALHQQWSIHNNFTMMHKQLNLIQYENIYLYMSESYLVKQPAPKITQ
jgi:hypothetical protein